MTAADDTNVPPDELSAATEAPKAARVDTQTHPSFVASAASASMVAAAAAAGKTFMIPMARAAFAEVVGMHRIHPSIDPSQCLALDMLRQDRRGASRITPETTSPTSAFPPHAPAGAGVAGVRNAEFVVGVSGVILVAPRWPRRSMFRASSRRGSIEGWVLCIPAISANAALALEITNALPAAATAAIIDADAADPTNGGRICVSTPATSGATSAVAGVPGVGVPGAEQEAVALWAARHRQELRLWWL